MSLLLDHRWESALVASVVEAVKGSHPRSYLGRTAVQKLVYFLHVLNVPMQFKFRIHHFGPFCDELAGTLDWLRADDIIRDEAAEGSRYSDFANGPNWGELKAQFEDVLKEYHDEVDAVATAFGGMDPRTLELVATLDFSYRWVKARGGNGPWMAAAIQKLKEIKGDKFADEEIASWYGKLVQVKLIEP